MEKIKQQFGTQTRISDIGLRPQTVMKSNIAALREKSAQIGNIGILTNEEIAWLNQGFYTPLFVFTPQRLIAFVTKRLGKQAKPIAVENSEAKAKAIGFMTWVGE